MTKKNELYKCEVCGNVVSIIEEGFGTLICCNQNMKLLEEINVQNEGKEKHVPVLTLNGNTAKITVGSVEHPMEEKHYIRLIQLLKDEKVILEKILQPGEKPMAEFHNLEDTNKLSARAYCNLHGLWKN